MEESCSYIFCKNSDHCIPKDTEGLGNIGTGELVRWTQGLGAWGLGNKGLGNIFGEHRDWKHFRGTSGLGNIGFGEHLCGT